MRIENLAKTEVVTVGPSAHLDVAAQRMNADRIGSLVVMEGNTLVGIITERDLLRAMADGVPAGETQVSQYMTQHPATAIPDEETETVAERMAKLGVRHLPLLRGDRLVGIVSARELAGLEAWPRSGVDRST